MHRTPRAETSDGISAEARIAENDVLRSDHVRALLLEERPRGPSGTQRSETAKVPRVIVQYWHDSADVPADVRDCLESWKSVGAVTERLLFDDESARKFISSSLGSKFTSAFDRCRHPAMRCDYFRLCFILVRGGFYVDADERYLGTGGDELFDDNTLKLQPLCYDVARETMVSPLTFLNARSSSRDWTFYVNNNPLIAPPGHPVVRLALVRATRLLLSRSKLVDVQSITGPGNLSASLVHHALVNERAYGGRDFSFLTNWDEISVSQWPLSYRSDERNWRLWKPTE